MAPNNNAPVLRVEQTMEGAIAVSAFESKEGRSFLTVFQGQTEVRISSDDLDLSLIPLGWPLALRVVGEMSVYDRVISFRNVSQVSWKIIERPLPSNAAGSIPLSAK